MGFRSILEYVVRLSRTWNLLYPHWFDFYNYNCTFPTLTIFPEKSAQNRKKYLSTLNYLPKHCLHSPLPSIAYDRLTHSPAEHKKSLSMHIRLTLTTGSSVSHRVSHSTSDLKPTAVSGPFIKPGGFFGVTYRSCSVRFKTCLLDKT